LPNRQNLPVLIFYLLDFITTQPAESAGFAFLPVKKKGEPGSKPRSSAVTYPQKTEGMNHAWFMPIQDQIDIMIIFSFISSFFFGKTQKK